MLCSFSWLHLSGVMHRDCSIGMCIKAWQLSTVVEFTITTVCITLGAVFFLNLFLVDDELGHLSPMSADPSPCSLLLWSLGNVAQSDKVKVWRAGLWPSLLSCNGSACISWGKCHAPTDLRCHVKRRDPFTVILRSSFAYGVSVQRIVSFGLKLRV